MAKQQLEKETKVKSLSEEQTQSEAVKDEKTVFVHCKFDNDLQLSEGTLLLIEVNKLILNQYNLKPLKNYAWHFHCCQFS